MECLSAPVGEVEVDFLFSLIKKRGIGPWAYPPLDAWKTEVFRIAFREPEVPSASRRST